MVKNNCLLLAIYLKQLLLLIKNTADYLLKVYKKNLYRPKNFLIQI